MSVGGLINVPVDVNALARSLERHPDYRVQRRLPQFAKEQIPGLRKGVISGVALDVETTGLDYRQDRVIELAMCRFWADENGRIVEVDDMDAHLEDPGVEITPEITRVTGLCRADLKGRAIRDGDATGLLLSADFIVSHNAAFDRPFVEARLPEVAGRPWCCSLNEVDWKGLGFEGRTQSQLLCAMGAFYDAHRASVDVNALLHLLDHELPKGSTVLSLLLDRARRTTFRLEARRTPRTASPALRKRGWRWSGEQGAWTIEVAQEQRDEEVDWATIHVYSALDVPKVTAIDWWQRHAAP